jgi:hypothetical protein
VHGCIIPHTQHQHDSLFFIFACGGGVRITHQIRGNDVLHNGMKLVKNRRILTQMFFEDIGIRGKP